FPSSTPPLNQLPHCHQLMINNRRSLINYFFSSRRRHTRFSRDWSSDVCSSDLPRASTPTRYSGAGKIHMSLWRMPSTTRRPTVKIGRASCRERGNITAVVVPVDKRGFLSFVFSEKLKPISNIIILQPIKDLNYL